MGSGAIAPHIITLPSLGRESREGSCVPSPRNYNISPYSDPQS
jgi:hypothetical protein